MQDRGRFRVLGGLRLDLPDGGPTGRAAQKKRLSVLAVLAASHPDGVGREVLSTLLWPDADPERSRRRLSSTLYELRQALGPVVVEVAESLHYDPAVVTCDLIDWKRALDSGDAEAAAASYGGPFLDGIFVKGADEFERWASTRRDEYERRHAAALESEAEAREAAGDRVGAAEWWRRLAARDPYNARVAARTMRALAAAGDRAGAVRHGTRHAEALRADLEVEPDAEILALMDEMRAPLPPGNPAVTEAGRPRAPRPTQSRSEGPRPPAAPRDRRAHRAAASAGALLLVFLGAVWMASGAGLGGPSPAPVDPPLLAVLPFENLGSAEEEYFADGITEEVNARLTAAPGLRVIGRTTAVQFAGMGQEARRIGEELGVDYVLRGSVRWQREPGEVPRVRVTPELIRVADDVQLWARVYDREVAQIFAVQAMIARDVAEELGLRLGEPADAPPSGEPTDDLEAYGLFLQANAHGQRRVSEASARAAVALYERALELDPHFAGAWGRLVHARVWLAWLVADRDQGTQAREDLERLLEFGEDRIEVRLGRGWYLYYGQRRYEEALRDFQWVHRIRPGDPEVLKTIGYLQRRMGHWDQAVATMREALELSPRDHALSYTLAQSLHWLGRFEEAERHYERAILLAPDIPSYHGALGDLHVARGDTVRAWETLARARTYDVRPWYRPRVHLFGRAFPTALEGLRAHAPAQPLLALSRLDAMADASGRTGDEQGRAIHADSLLQRALALAPEEGGGGGMEIHNTALVFAGLAWAHLGDAEEALHHVTRGLGLETGFGDAVASVQAKEAGARAFVRLGRFEEALDLLDSLLASPSSLAPGELRLDPEWDPLREHPRFLALVAD